MKHMSSRVNYSIRMWQLLFKVIEDWNDYDPESRGEELTEWQLLFKVIEDWNPGWSGWFGCENALSSDNYYLR